MLTQEEIIILCGHHKWWSRYYRDCERTNVELSSSPKGTAFTRDEWMERAQAFAVKRKHHQARAKYFKQILRKL